MAAGPGEWGRVRGGGRADNARPVAKAWIDGSAQKRTHVCSIQNKTCTKWPKAKSDVRRPFRAHAIHRNASMRALRMASSRSRNADQPSAATVCIIGPWRACTTSARNVRPGSYAPVRRHRES
eukprot:2723542-Pleurochrysis_carterae.AAC.3